MGDVVTIPTEMAEGAAHVQDALASIAHAFETGEMKYLIGIAFTTEGKIEVALGNVGEISQTLVIGALEILRFKMISDKVAEEDALEFGDEDE